jgi:hypothetical protein
MGALGEAAGDQSSTIKWQLTCIDNAAGIPAAPARAS